MPEYISVRRLLAYGICSLCGYAAWARGGVYAPFQWPLIILSIFLCIGVLFLHPQMRQDFRTKLLRDPVFSIGFIFLSLVVIQSLNSGYRVESNANGLLEFIKVPNKWMPWSAVISESMEMLIWFFSAWVSALLVRNLLSRRHLKPLLYIMAWNSAALACLGICLYLSGSSRLMGIWKLPGHAHYATFEYANHAAEWFYLNAFLAAGLAHDALVKRRPKIQQVIWCSTFLLCVISVFLTLSRFGAVLSSLLLLVALIVYFRRTFSHRKGKVSINIYIVACIVVMGGLALFTGAGGGKMANEIKERSVSQDLGGRIRQFPSAIAIIGDYPLFGAGGGAYQWLAPLHVAEEDSAILAGMGALYVHCDPLQFLCEFGFVGGLCLVAIIVLLFYACLRNINKQSVISIWILVGLGIIVIHSFADLPFRNPAILYEWAVLLTALPKLIRFRERVYLRITMRLRLNRVKPASS